MSMSYIRGHCIGTSVGAFRAALSFLQRRPGEGAVPVLARPGLLPPFSSSSFFLHSRSAKLIGARSI